MPRPVVKNASLSICIKSMWRNWFIPVGAIMLILILSVFRFIDNYLLAAITAISAIVLMQIRNAYKRSVDTSMCITTTVQVNIALVLSSILMITVLVLDDGSFETELNGQPFNSDIPFLPTLVISLFTALVTGTVWALHINERLMRRYMRTIGARTIMTTFRARLLNREAIFHNRLLCILSSVIALIGIIYYFWAYINVSLSHRDIMVFVGIPIILYIITLIYLALRYYSFFTYYCHNDYLEIIDRGGKTSVRFLIICDDKLFLVPREFNASIRYDTPAAYILPYRNRFMLYDAVNMLREHGLPTDETHIIEAFSFDDEPSKHNIFHFFAFIKSKKIMSELFPDGEWLSVGNIQQMYSEGRITSELTGELHRIYTIAMAWKTYDARGYRRYKIRNYKPTFRFRDIKDWDVDYNDDNWLYVSRRNQDKPFFHLHRFFTFIKDAMRSDEIN